MIDNRTKSIPTSSSEVGIYYVYISQGNKDNGVYIVSDFVLPITVTKIAELYIGDDDKANLTGGNTFTGNQIINGDITVEDITANNFLGNASTATKLKTFVNINGVAFDGSSNITIYDGTKEATITPGNTSQYFRGDKTWQTLNKIVVGLSNVDNTADANKNVLSATKLTIPRTINNVTFDGSENIVINAIDITPRIPISYMGIANGVATLDSNGIIPITQLPSYVDDVIEVANYVSLPIIGESGKIYVTTNNNKTYRWSGSVYVYITSGAVDSVNGYTGVVVLTKSDFILGNVDNTSDANKPISIATQVALDLKQNLLTLGNFTSTTPGVTISNGNGAVIGSGITFNITTAGATTGGLITSGHWNTFNNKWDSSNHPITTLGYGLPDYPTTLPASDVYSWAKQSTKPTYSYSEITSKPTLLSQFTNDLGNYGNWITGINSGMITTALGYTPLPTRTFGSAANNNTGDFYAIGSTVANSTLWNGHAIVNSAVQQMHFPLVYSSTLGAWGYGVASQFQSWLGLGSSAYTNTNDHILNQNASAQSASMWISGNIRVDNSIASQLNGSDTVGAGARFGLLNSAGDRFMIHQLNASNGEDIWSSDGISYRKAYSLSYLGAATFASTVNATQFNAAVSSDIFTLKLNNSWSNTLTKFSSNGSTGGQNIQVTNVAESAYLPLHLQPNGGITTFGGTVNSTGFLLNGNNLTSSLTTNYLPKWNGSSFVNSISSDDNYKLVINANDASGNRYSPFNSLTVTTDNPNSPYALFGGSVLFKNRSYSHGVVESSRIRSVIYDDGNNLGGGFIFETTPTAGGTLTPSLSISYNRQVSVLSTTSSTSPTTGALVVGGGIGANHIQTYNTTGGWYSLVGGANQGNGDKVVIGTLGNLATIGAHNGALNAWAHLSINQGGGNVSIGYPSNQDYKLAVNGTGYFNGPGIFNGYLSADYLKIKSSSVLQIFNDGTSSNQLRWDLKREGTETGSNAGSYLRLYRYADDGSFMGHCLTIERASGNSTFTGNVTASNFIGKSNGFYTVQITQAAYTALGTKDASTIYMIVG